MSKKILIITDNVPEQINGVVVTFKSMEEHALLDGYNIVYLTPLQFLHFNCPGYPEVKLAIPWDIGKKIEEISPDIYTSPQRVLLVCSLDFILTNGVIVTILLTILSSLNF